MKSYAGPGTVLLSLLLPCVSLAAGIFMMIYFCLFIDAARKSAHWPVVEGRLISRGVASYGNSTIGSRYGRYTYGTSTSYGLVVEYAYSINGNNYIGRKFSHELKSRDREYWEEKARHYIAGAPVSVHYNPDDHSDAVIETGKYGLYYIFIVMGMLLAGYGGYESFRITGKSFFGRTPRD